MAIDRTSHFALRVVPLALALRCTVLPPLALSRLTLLAARLLHKRHRPEITDSLCARGVETQASNSWGAAQCGCVYVGGWGGARGGEGGLLPSALQLPPRGAAWPRWRTPGTEPAARQLGPRPCRTQPRCCRRRLQQQIEGRRHSAENADDTARGSGQGHAAGVARISDGRLAGGQLQVVRRKRQGRHRAHALRARWQAGVSMARARGEAGRAAAPRPRAACRGCTLT